MRISRFYLPNIALTKGDEGKNLCLNKQQAHYALTVLRLKDQRQIEVFDGKGTQAQATLLHSSRRSAEVHINTIQTPVTESPLKTILLQAISKGDRMDYTVQKMVELGITQIQPLWTEYCDLNKLSDDKQAKKHQQWQDIAINACEQSGRNIVPEVLPPKNYQSWLDSQQHTDFKGFVLDPYTDNTLKTFAQNNPKITTSIHLLIGPEGGLSTNEIEQAKQVGFKAIKLGPRILRTETAGITILSIIQSLWGDF